MTRGRGARRIAILIESLEGGGAQRRMVDLANGFVPLGRQVDLLVARPDGKLRARVAPSIKIVELDRDQPEISLSDYLDQVHPDALVAGSASVHALAVNGIRRSAQRVPLVLRASSHPYRYIPWTLPRQRLVEYVRRRLRIGRYAVADLIIAVSDDIHRALRAALPKARIVTIKSPVITTDFLAGAEAQIDWPWNDGADIPTIIAVGRFAMAKDFPTLLRAFALLRREQEARLVIIGDGSARERSALAALATRLGIVEDVAFPGESDVVGAWLRRADLFVSSSLWEGSAGALVEALGMGCPVVATSSVGSARELLEHGRIGRLVPPRHPRRMALAMIEELRTRRDPDLLKATAAPYASSDRAADYLAAIDGCVADVAAYMDGK